MEIILASASPRRRELIKILGKPFSVVTSDAEEIIDPELPPYFVAEKLSLLKASDVAGKLKNEKKDAIVIGADTIVVKDGKILTKPKDEIDAQNMLKTLSGTHHSVITGVTVINNKTAKSESFYVETKVFFKNLTDNEIKKYIESGEPMDKAGAYGIQEKGALFVEKIEGDYFNVVGLPICKLASLLKEEFSLEF